MPMCLYNCFTVCLLNKMFSSPYPYKPYSGRKLQKNNVASCANSVNLTDHFNNVEICCSFDKNLLAKQDI